jgi:hypothetical protein
LVFGFLASENAAEFLEALFEVGAEAPFVRAVRAVLLYVGLLFHPKVFSERDLGLELRRASAEKQTDSESTCYEVDDAMVTSQKRGSNLGNKWCLEIKTFTVRD